MKRTALYAAQKALHAKFIPFGGWELAVSYTSILQEHQAVRTGVGLFDVSHLGHLEVSGPEAVDRLDPLFTQDLGRLEVGRAVYSPMLNPQGFILDEMILYRLGADRIRLVVNAANGDKVLEWLRGHLRAPFTTSSSPSVVAEDRLQRGSDSPLDSRLRGNDRGVVAVEDLRERVGTLAVQGPRAVGLVEELARGSLGPATRYSVRPGQIGGRPAFFARTGYTGEDGFELFLAAADLEPVWSLLLEAGRPLGIQPVGLGARDTLRLEAGLPLGGTDLDETTTPLEAGMEWTVAWQKGPFIGREALERQRREGLKRRLVGFRLKGPGIPRTGYPIHAGAGAGAGGNRIGQVTSGTFLPDQGQAIGLGLVAPEASAPGSDLSIEIHGRQVPAQVVQLPFYRRQKQRWQIPVS
ncbi:MAG: glycine cleavage system protein T [Candidatus Omnitrophica bacterium]|nr:glycine cleavage system protein T [Candidatus Omnitrophota bacterium]